MVQGSVSLMLVYIIIRLDLYSYVGGAIYVQSKTETSFSVTTFSLSFTPVRQFKDQRLKEPVAATKRRINLQIPMPLKRLKISVYCVYDLLFLYNFTLVFVLLFSEASQHFLGYITF